jgi:hypothetical protein
MSTQTKIEWRPAWWYRWVDDRVPPLWLRHFIPLSLVHWYCRRFGYCRAQATMWWLDGSDSSWRPWLCIASLTAVGSCVCGLFYRGSLDAPPVRKSARGDVSS